MSEPMLGGMAQTERDRPEPLLRPGNTNCGGCGLSVMLQMLSRAVAHTPVQLVIPACCAVVAAGPFPFSGYSAPVIACAFASTAAVATGLAHVARLNGEKTRVICIAGDGGTADIGMAALSAAAERNEDLFYVCYDNEIYGNTGGQRSSATPLGAVTTTTSGGKEEPKKDIVGIMAAHAVPYTATVSLAHPEDALRKMRHALELAGFRFLHVLSPCPTGWKSEPAQGIELLRLAVRSGLYPVYEIFDGHRVVVNVEPEMSDEALARYFAGQRRFAKSKIALGQVRAEIERVWQRLRERAG
ncbi:MAG: pyruvate synthase subunit beta [Deltaproteobacteria bacterium]|nr:pyruvate synthase subunit beta [Deltaproteobacteria bacterium]